MMAWVIIAVQGGLFAVWAWTAFRILFRLSARMRAQSGQMLPGPRRTLQGFALFLRDPDHARDRRVLGLLTLALLASSILVRSVLGADHG